MNWKDRYPKNNRFFETENGILYNGDSLDVLKDFQDESIDLIIIDPPYGVSSNEKNGIDYRDEYFDFKIIDELYRVLKNNSRMYLFIAQNTLCKTMNNIKNFSLNQIITWFKPNILGGKRVFDYTNCSEFILNYHKGKPKKLINPKKIDNSFSSNIDVLKYTQPQSNYKIDKRVHIHQKPFKLYQHLIISTLEEGISIDCFAGSGTIAVSNEKLNRKWIAIEKNKEYCDIIVNRIKEIKNGNNYS